MRKYPRYYNECRNSPFGILLLAGGVTALLFGGQLAALLLASGALMILCDRKSHRRKPRRVDGVLALEAEVAIAGGPVAPIRHGRRSMDVP